ncbi:MAG: hypothetical protein MZV70_01125, partial [Desulfobacterales bacterium]|nr:hypothetical protein [Desulfobacterales bacterium]
SVGGSRAPSQSIAVGGLIHPRGHTGKASSAQSVSVAASPSTSATSRPRCRRRRGHPGHKEFRHLCRGHEDFTLCMECPKQCPTGALRPVEKERVTMGMALIDLEPLLRLERARLPFLQQVCPGRGSLRFLQRRVGQSTLYQRTMRGLRPLRQILSPRGVGHQGRDARPVYGQRRYDRSSRRSSI